MSAIHLEAIRHQTNSGLPYNHLHIQILDKKGLISPIELKGLKLPANIDFSQGIIIEGKAPIWLYCYLVHQSYPARWVGCYDPRLGAVVVATHTHEISIAEVLAIELPTAVS